MMGSQSAVQKNHIAIALGIGLGIVALIVICLLFAAILHRRYANHPLGRKDFSDKLRRLDAATPVRTLEEFWSTVKGPLTPTEGTDGQFNCAVCLEHVLRDQEIRELKCLHIFHKECLEKWYLKNHFNCPLCHRPYYAQETHPTNDYVWMV